MNPSPVLVFIQSAAALISLCAVLVALWVALRSDGQRRDDRERDARAHANRVRAEVVMIGGTWAINDGPTLTRGVTVGVVNASPDSVLAPTAVMISEDHERDRVVEVEIVGSLPAVMLPAETRTLQVMPLRPIEPGDPSGLSVADLGNARVRLSWSDYDGRHWRADFGSSPTLELLPAAK